MDEMIGNAEEFYQSLGIPYRVVNIVSGEEESKYIDVRGHCRMGAVRDCTISLRKQFHQKLTM